MGHLLRVRQHEPGQHDLEYSTGKHYHYTQTLFTMKHAYYKYKIFFNLHQILFGKSSSLHYIVFLSF